MAVGVPVGANSVIGSPCASTGQSHAETPAQPRRGVVCRACEGCCRRCDGRHGARDGLQRWRHWCRGVRQRGRRRTGRRGVRCGRPGQLLCRAGRRRRRQRRRLRQRSWSRAHARVATAWWRQRQARQRTAVRWSSGHRPTTTAHVRRQHPARVSAGQHQQGGRPVAAAVTRAALVHRPPRLHAGGGCGDGAAAQSRAWRNARGRRHRNRELTDAGGAAGREGHVCGGEAAHRCGSTSGGRRR